MNTIERAVAKVQSADSTSDARPASESASEPSPRKGVSPVKRFIWIILALAALLFFLYLAAGGFAL